MSADRTLRVMAYSDSTGLGGAELALAYAMGALGAHVEVAVLAVCEAVAETIASRRPGAAIYMVPPARGADDRRALLANMRAIRAFRPDVLHASQAWPWACGYGELAAMLTPGVRVLAVDHLPVGGAIPRRRLVARRLLARRLDAHVAVGERSARLIEKLVGLAHGSVRSVPNGVPALPQPAALIEGDGRVIGSVGRLTEQKGYQRLVRSLARLPSDSRLVIVGDGPSRSSLEELARQLGVGARVQITGWDPEPRRQLPSFDVFVLPSREEGMPLAILEAMHAGRPVVASDVGSVAEVVSDGETGYVVPPDDDGMLVDRIRRLLDDPALRLRMGRRGQAMASERFTDTVMAGRYESIYRLMLARHARRGLRGSSRAAR